MPIQGHTLQPRDPKVSEAIFDKSPTQFAIQFATFLNRLLTPCQRKQQDIILEPNQVAHITNLERGYEFGGKTKDNIKEGVALHFLEVNQTL